MPNVSGRANCCMTVNGSWCRPTMSAPKMRSEGARTTGAAISSVSSAATTATPAASAACRRKVDHPGNQEHRGDQRPPPDIADHRRDPGIRKTQLPGAVDAHLTPPKQARPTREPCPAAGHKCGDPQSEKEPRLERRQEPQRPLRIL